MDLDANQKIKITYIQEFDENQNLLPVLEIYESPRQNLLEISLKNRIPHIHACGGKGKCSTCRVLIIKGEENLEEPNTIEKQIASKKGLGKRIRLACQTIVKGNIKIKRLVRDPVDIDIVLSSHYSGREAIVAILYIGIHNFYDLVKKHPAYDVFHFLNRFYKLVGDHSNGHMQFYKEGVAIIFGLKDKDITKKCKDAYASAMEILNQIPQFNEYLKKNYQSELKTGMSLHLGEVIAGDSGYLERMQFLAYGESIQFASRLEKVNAIVKTQLIASEDFIKGFQNPDFIQKKLRTAIKEQGGIYNVYELLIQKRSYLSLRSLIKSQMTKTIAPIILRMVFHDVMSGGNISSSFRDEERLEWELQKAENQNLEQGAEFIKTIKRLIKEEPYSYRDILYLAGAVAVEITGGPYINVVVPSFQDKNFYEIGIPDREETFESYYKKFFQLNFTKREVVAIMGAHTLGKAEDVSFTEDLFEFTNTYYKRFLQKGMREGLHPLFKTDWELLKDEETRSYIELYAIDEEEFFEDFKKAYLKLISFAN